MNSDSAMHLKQNIFQSHVSSRLFFFSRSFNKKAFAQCLISGLMLVIAFANSGPFMRVVSVEILSFVQIHIYLVKCIVSQSYNQIY